MSRMGLQSTLFGPVEYAILPRVPDETGLSGGHALVETGTSQAILLGLVAGGPLMSLDRHGPPATALAVLPLAIAGYAASRRIPPLAPGAPALPPRPNPLAATREVLAILRGRRMVLRSVLGISWFRT